MCILYGLWQKRLQRGETLWFASLDLEKTFDKVFFEYVYNSLMGTGVPAEIIGAIETIYEDLSAYVQLEPNNESRTSQYYVASGRETPCHQYSSLMFYDRCCQV